jgi:hypothetical protein
LRSAPPVALLLIATNGAANAIKVSQREQSHRTKSENREKEYRAGLRHVVLLHDLSSGLYFVGAIALGPGTKPAE